eukprot:3941340-Rhodomonas_salina.2
MPLTSEYDGGRSAKGPQQVNSNKGKYSKRDLSRVWCADTRAMRDADAHAPLGLALSFRLRETVCARRVRC